MRAHHATTSRSRMSARPGGQAGGVPAANFRPAKRGLGVYDSDIDLHTCLITALALIVRQAIDDIIRGLANGWLEPGTLNPVITAPKRVKSHTWTCADDAHDAVKFIRGKRGRFVCDLINQVSGRDLTDPESLLRMGLRNLQSIPS